MHGEIDFQKERISALHADNDHSVDRPDLDHDRALLKAEKELRRRGEREKERRDDRDRREQEHDEREFEHDSTRDINLQPFSNKRRAFRSGADQLHQDGEVEENFSTLPSSSSYDDKSTVKSEFLHAVLIYKLLIFEVKRWIM